MSIFANQEIRGFGSLAGDSKDGLNGGGIYGEKFEKILKVEFTAPITDTDLV